MTRLDLRRTLVALALCALSAPVCLAQGTARSSQPDPDALAAAYTAAFNARNATSLAAFFAEDALLMPPDTASIRGRANIEAAYRARFPIVVGRLEMRRLDVIPGVDRATVIGTFSLTPGPDQVGARTANGKYVVVYRRYGEQWLIAYQIVNYDESTPR
jgi:uncharacterized protein (TIGR02246 family)